MSIIGQERRATFAIAETRGKVAVMSSAKVDRVGDVIDQAGWELAEFQKNPVMLYNHDHDEPVGVWQDVKVEGGKLVGVPVFHPAEINPFAGKLAKLYEGGWLKAFSVGFRVLEAEPIPGGQGWLIKRAELYECSAAVIPANTDALLGAKSGARIVPIFGAELPAERRREGRDMEAIRKWVAPATESRVESAAMLTRAEVEAMIAKALGSIKDEQPAAPPADKAPADGTVAGDDEDDLVAVEIAETEAEAAELASLIAEIENETGTQEAT